MTTVHVEGLGENPVKLNAPLRTPDGVRFLDELAGKRIRQNGCGAAAYAALYANVDVITAYPIRPYTAIMMNLSQFIADGILDAEYIVADGEHSQFSAAFGAGSCGARAYTGPAGRLRLRAHRRAVHARHGLADGVGGDAAGGLRQDPHRLRDRRGSPGAAAADGGPGRVLRLAHRGRGGHAL